MARDGKSFSREPWTLFFYSLPLLSSANGWRHFFFTVLSFVCCCHLSPSHSDVFVDSCIHSVTHSIRAYLPKCTATLCAIASHPSHSLLADLNVSLCQLFSCGSQWNKFTANWVDDVHAHVFCVLYNIEHGTLSRTKWVHSIHIKCAQVLVKPLSSINRRFWLKCACKSISLPIPMRSNSSLLPSFRAASRARGEIGRSQPTASDNGNVHIYDTHNTV